VITATVAPDQLTLGSCPEYLRIVASLADCIFHFAPGGLTCRGSDETHSTTALYRDRRGSSGWSIREFKATALT
jgi:hypothetical protein